MLVMVARRSTLWPKRWSDHTVEGQFAYEALQYYNNYIYHRKGYGADILHTWL